MERTRALEAQLVRAAGSTSPFHTPILAAITRRAMTLVFMGGTNNLLPDVAGGVESKNARRGCDATKD